MSDLSRRFALTLLCAAVALSGCEKIQEARNTANAIKAASTAAATMSQEVTKAADRAEARRAKGDTLSVPFRELEAYLPATVAGYQPVGEPEGSTMTMTGMSYSTCSRESHTPPSSSGHWQRPWSRVHTARRTSAGI